MLAKGDFEGAIICFQAGLVRPNGRLDPYQHTRLGDALRAKGDIDGAIRCYQTALKIDDDMPRDYIRNRLGNALKDKGDITLNNGVTFAQGEVASAFQFNTSNYVSANTSGLPTGNSNRTLEMWVKASSFPTSAEAYFAGYGNFGSSNQTYHLGTTGSNLFWSQWGTGIGGPSLSANRWYHVAVTNVGNSATLYLDGVAVGSNTVTINTPAGTSFYVGRIPGTLGDSRKLDGMVDEVSVYNRALSAAEIQASVGTETPSAGKDSVLRFNAMTGAPAGVSGQPGDAVFIASGWAPPAAPPAARMRPAASA